MNSRSICFTSTPVGFEIEAGKLSLDDRVMKSFPDDATANPSDNVKAMKMRDLPTISCGHETGPDSVVEAPSSSKFGQ